jgi:hypothetical protein
LLFKFEREGPKLAVVGIRLAASWFGLGHEGDIDVIKDAENKSPAKRL